MDGGVGATLRDARNRRKLDLSEVEAAIKIRARLLRAIENEEWDSLPGGSYPRSFIRTYANFLGLDGERLAEEQARESQPGRARDPGPRVEPEPLRPAAGRRWRLPRLPSWASVAIVCAVLVAVLVAVGLSGGGGSGPARLGKPPARGSSPRSAPVGAPHRGASSRLKLELAATAEVWVCVLDAADKPVVAGQILEAGDEAGPFRSDSFTVAFGNGEVAMTIDGRKAPIPESSSPVGYSIDSGGKLAELSEGERPTCE